MTTAKLKPGQTVYLRSGRSGVFSRVTPAGRAVIRYAGGGYYYPPLRCVMSRNPEIYERRRRGTKPKRRVATVPKFTDDEIYRLAKLNGISIEDAREAVRG